MFTKNEFEKKMQQLVGHAVRTADSECVHTEEQQQGDKMLITCCYLYFNYEYNCIIHYKEITEGVIDASGDVNEVQTLGYETLKRYKFRQNERKSGTVCGTL